MKTKLIYAFLIGSLVINILLLFIIFNKDSNSVEELQSKYPHLSQRILGDYDRDLILHFVPLRAKLRELVEKNYGGDFSFYFEYLPTGVSIGVNEKIEFYSTSLLKVPTVMALYHMKEGKNIKEDKEVIIGTDDIDKDFGNLWQKGSGQKIKLSEAARLSLVESDNTATKVLLKNIEPEDFDAIYDGLDIRLTRNKDSDQISITTKAYASILKALFFSSVLSKEDSEYILELLTKTKFKDKLPAGIPEDVPVAHKISVYEKLGNTIYSDCGIVYVLKRQYLLCMASRSNEEVARERMKTVSKIIYDFVSTTNNLH